MKTIALSLFLGSALAAQDQARIDAAVKKGVEWLRTARTPGVEWANIDDSSEIVLLAFVHAGVPETDSKYQEYFHRLMERPLERTYSVALQAMILEEIDRVKHQARIARCAQFLIDNQCVNGQWSYGRPTTTAIDVPVLKDLPTGPRETVREFAATGRKEKPAVRLRIPVRKMKDGPATGDNSNSQYAALGLRACHDAGILLPREVLLLARKWWFESQHAEAAEDRGVATGPETSAPARGWCYSKTSVCSKRHRPYASMTAGAVGALAICDAILDLDCRKDPAIRSGLAWLQVHWSVTTNAGPAELDGSPKSELYYALYALERAGMLLDLPRIGTHDWYPEGARAILAAQKPDGSWDGGVKRCDPTWDTCFAILFLKKATRSLDVASQDRKLK